jgi:hypothetical protein
MPPFGMCRREVRKGKFKPTPPASGKLPDWSANGKPASKHQGYRDLTPEEISSMNTIKDMAEDIRVELEALESLPEVDKRWLAIGKTNLQQGFMAVIRSIAKPTTF